jgi:hypothetical protein
LSRNLVIVRAGRRSLHPFWKDAGSETNWDIYVCPFQELPAEALPSGCHVGQVRPGPKWTGVRELLKEWDGWRDYRYVMLADDDLMMGDTVLGPFFDLCGRAEAKLAQPALTEQSPFGHVITLRNRACLARQTTFVEVMMPTFRSDVLAELLWTLDLTETGWGFGLDALWAKLLGYEGLLIADHYPVVHTKPVGRIRDPDLERQVRAEMRQLLTKYDCRFWQKTKKAHLPRGAAVADPDPALLHTLIKGYDYLFDRYPEQLPIFIAQQGRSGPA